MNRIDAKFSSLRATGQKAFVAYITAGDPHLGATAKFAREFERAGVDVLELGVPFSDPLADGVVNQLAAERALRSGTTLGRVLRMVAALRKSGGQIPVVLYIYFNLIHRYGVKKFARAAARAGVDGVLALDLPPEEAAEYERAITQAGVHPIYLVAPTTPAKRVREIARHATGFLYCISREGVTGMQPSVSNRMRPMVETIRRYTDLPVCIGFGVSTASQAATVAAAGDGVVVGSAIVNQIAKHGAAASKVARFVRPLVKAVKAV